MKYPKRLVWAFIAGPWAVTPLIFGVLFMWKALRENLRIFKLEELIYLVTLGGMASFIAVLVAYAHVIIWGIPCYFYLKKTNCLLLAYILPVAFIAGAITGLFFSTQLIGIDRQEPILFILAIEGMLTIFFGICGMAVAYTIWNRGVR